MSLAPTLPVPELTQRRIPLSEEPSAAANNVPGEPFPGQFATPAPGTMLRRVVRPDRLSLSTILRRLTRRADPPPLERTSSKYPALTVRRKIFGDFRPNLLDDFTQFDELDPLPFVDDEEARGDRPRFDHMSQLSECRNASSYPRCVVVERRERPTSAREKIDGGDSTPSFECYLLDVNMSGIAIHTVRSFPRGSILDVRIHTAMSDRVIETSGAVVRCKPWKAGGFQVVCRLEKYLQFAEIRDVGRELFASAIV
jgi:hypothetical protein